VSPQEFIERWHYAGLFGIVFVEEAGVPLPVPGDLFIAAAGFLAYRGEASGPAVVAIVAAATVLGASVLFTLARRGGRPLLQRYARRFGYTEERERRVERWLTRRGAAAVILGRLVPGLRIVMTVVAGALGMGRATFVAGTVVAGALWGTIWFWIGWGVAAGWGRLAGIG
jgi:membrane protein DedA with SNARE-associated domain